VTLRDTQSPKEPADAPAVGQSSAGLRFPCPSCGVALRHGSIFCSHCDTSLLSAPASSGDPGEGPQASWEQPPAWPAHRGGPATGARSGAMASVVIGVATLVTRFMLPMMLRSPALAQLVLPLSLLVMVGGFGGLLLGRRAAQRVVETGDTRWGMLATLGTWIGWGNVALTVAGFFLAPVHNILDNVSR